MLKLNEYRLIKEKHDHVTLNSGIENLKIDTEALDDALETFGKRQYSYFQPLPSPIGITDGVHPSKQMSVFVPVDRLRLKMLDNLFFYPVTFYAVYYVIEQILVYPLIPAGGSEVSVTDWYITIWPFVVDITLGYFSNTFYSAFIIWTIVATVAVLVTIFGLYWVIKFFISWTPSMLINLTFGLYLEG